MGRRLFTGGVDCIFCDIVTGRRESHRVYADESVVAFLDARPLFHGHTLVVPREHRETLTDLPASDMGPFFTRVRRITAAVESAMEAAGSFVAANNRISQSVPHFHVHVVPRNPKDGLRGFFWPRGRYGSEDAAAAVAARLRSALAE